MQINTSIIHISVNLIFYECTKHIEVGCHFVCKAFEAQTISLPHVSSNLQVANIFTKALTRLQHNFLTNKLMLMDNPHQFAGDSFQTRPDPMPEFRVLTGSSGRLGQFYFFN